MYCMLRQKTPTRQEITKKPGQGYKNKVWEVVQRLGSEVKNKKKDCVHIFVQLDAWENTNKGRRYLTQACIAMYEISDFENVGT